MSFPMRARIPFFCFIFRLLRRCVPRRGTGDPNACAAAADSAAAAAACRAFARSSASRATPSSSSASRSRSLRWASRIPLAVELNEAADGAAADEEPQPEDGPEEGAKRAEEPMEVVLLDVEAVGLPVEKRPRANPQLRQMLLPEPEAVRELEREEETGAMPLPVVAAAVSKAPGGERCELRR